MVFLVEGMFVTLEKCREGQGFSRYSATTQRRICEQERTIEIMDLKLKAMAKELGKKKKRIRRMAKVSACRAASRAVGAQVTADVQAAQVQYARHAQYNLYVQAVKAAKVAKVTKGVEVVEVTKQVTKQPRAIEVVKVKVTISVEMVVLPQALSRFYDGIHVLLDAVVTVFVEVAKVSKVARVTEFVKVVVNSVHIVSVVCTKSNNRFKFKFKIKFCQKK